MRDLQLLLRYCFFSTLIAVGIFYLRGEGPDGGRHDLR